jgi:tetratricopeptide (TPR) repeat protein
MIRLLPTGRFGCAAYIVLLFCGSSASLLGQDAERRAAFALEQQGKVEDAETAWRALAKQYPKQAEPQAHIGLLEARQEHYSEAVTAYRKALALDPAMPGLRLNLGLALFKAGDYKQAIPTLEPLLETAPAGSPEAQRLTILLGMAHYGLKEFAAAVPYLQRASTQDDRNLTLLLTLAHSCLFARQFPCVLDTFHRLVALNADSAEADMLVGEALDEMKDPVGAVREFRAAIAANPKEPNAHFGLGYLLWTKGQYPEAAEQFQAEVDNNPNHRQAILYLADSDLQMNRLDQARTLLQGLAQADPSNVMEHLDLGIVYAEDGRNEDALRELKAAEVLSPDNVNVHWRLGRLYRVLGKTAEANAEFTRARSLNKAEDDRLLKVMSAIPAGEQKSSEDSEKK